MSKNAADILYTAVYDATGAAITDAWSTHYDELVAFYDANGRMTHTSVPLGRYTASWSRGYGIAERKERLETLPWWIWAVQYDDVWNARFAELVAYHAEHARIPPQTTKRPRARHMGRYTALQA
jgi:hypothetical protein